MANVSLGTQSFCFGFGWLYYHKRGQRQKEEMKIQLIAQLQVFQTLCSHSHKNKKQNHKVCKVINPESKYESSFVKTCGETFPKHYKHGHLHIEFLFFLKLIWTLYYLIWWKTINSLFEFCSVKFHFLPNV